MDQQCTYPLEFLRALRGLSRKVFDVGASPVIAALRTEPGVIRLFIQA